MFMSEEDHLRFVTSRVRRLDAGTAQRQPETEKKMASADLGIRIDGGTAPRGEKSSLDLDAGVEAYATEATQLNIIRHEVLRIAAVYAQYLDDGSDAGGGVARGGGGVGGGGGGGDGYREGGGMQALPEVGRTLELGSRGGRTEERTVLGIPASTMLGASLVLLVASLAAAAVALKPWLSKTATASLVSLTLSPFAALIRYRLGLWNKAHQTFPIYTFLCNMLGCLLTAAAAALARDAVTSSDSWTLVVLQALSAGFAGSLSTVSTLMAEARALPYRWLLLRYLGLTYLVSQLLLLTINLPMEEAS